MKPRALKGCLPCATCGCALPIATSLGQPSALFHQKKHHFETLVCENDSDIEKAFRTARQPLANLCSGGRRLPSRTSMANTWAIRQRLREGSDEIRAFELENAERASEDKAFGQYLDIANESAGPGFGALATCLLRVKCCPSVGLRTSKSQVAIHHVEDARYLPQALRKENGGEGGSQQQQRRERRGRWWEEMVWWVNFRLA